MNNESNSAPSPSAFGAMAGFLVPKLTVELSSNSTHDRSSVSLDQSKALRKERHVVRPPVQHNWSLPGHNDDAKTRQILQHELPQNFSINMFYKGEQPRFGFPEKNFSMNVEKLAQKGPYYELL